VPAAWGDQLADLVLSESSFVLVVENESAPSSGARTARGTRRQRGRGAH
jgi:hypothetical protein